MDDQVRNRLPEWSGDSFPGILLNAIAGRIANRFDLGGANYVIDAACASSLASLESAVRELESGQCNVAIAGGVDTMQSPIWLFLFQQDTGPLVDGAKCVPSIRQRTALSSAKALAFLF